MKPYCQIIIPKIKCHFQKGYPEDAEYASMYYHLEIITKPFLYLTIMITFPISN